MHLAWCLVPCMRHACLPRDRGRQPRPHPRDRGRLPHQLFPGWNRLGLKVSPPTHLGWPQMGRLWMAWSSRPPLGWSRPGWFPLEQPRLGPDRLGWCRLPLCHRLALPRHCLRRLMPRRSLWFRHDRLLLLRGHTRAAGLAFSVPSNAKMGRWRGLQPVLLISRKILRLNRVTSRLLSGFLIGVKLWSKSIRHC